MKLRSFPLAFLVLLALAVDGNARLAAARGHQPAGIRQAAALSKCHDADCCAMSESDLKECAAAGNACPTDVLVLSQILPFSDCKKCPVGQCRVGGACMCPTTFLRTEAARKLCTGTHGSLYPGSVGRPDSTRQDCDSPTLSPPAESPLVEETHPAVTRAPFQNAPSAVIPTNDRKAARQVASPETAVISPVKTCDCEYSDTCNGNPICAKKGTIVTDSCPRKYYVWPDCKLTPCECTYTDACNGKPICADEGDIIRDSCPRSYRVGRNCKLNPIVTKKRKHIKPAKSRAPASTVLGAPAKNDTATKQVATNRPSSTSPPVDFPTKKSAAATPVAKTTPALVAVVKISDCRYKDACNGMPFRAKKGSIVTDSCPTSFRVARDSCKLTIIKTPPNAVAANGPSSTAPPVATQLAMTAPAVASIQEACGCKITDACNRKSFCAKNGGIFTDSCLKSYRISRAGCKLTRIKTPPNAIPWICKRRSCCEMTLAELKICMPHSDRCQAKNPPQLRLLDKCHDCRVGVCRLGQVCVCLSTFLRSRTLRSTCATTHGKAWSTTGSGTVDRDRPPGKCKQKQGQRNLKPVPTRLPTPDPKPSPSPPSTDPGAKSRNVAGRDTPAPSPEVTKAKSRKKLTKAEIWGIVFGAIGAVAAVAGVLVTVLKKVEFVDASRQFNHPVDA